MFAKMVLPHLGGSSSVWTTAMVFFQAMLLAGYAYAHASARLLGPRRQALLHLVILTLACMALPVGVAAGWTAPGEQAPVPWLLGLMTVSVGAPFFVVAATAPLMQKWFAYTDHPAAADPYFLYGASNLGSLLALLGYPIMVEPFLRLGDQSWLWALGYVLLVAMIGGCSLPMWRRPVGALRVARSDGMVGPDGGVTWRRRLHWMLLAFAPSSLLLGVTAHITADVAAVPLLWVVPLALYLLTFVLVFARRPIINHEWIVRIQPLVIIPFVIYAFGVPSSNWWIALVSHLAILFIVTMVCHGELARRRPATSHLTEFYLWMSIGGVLGGIFNAILAPMLFDAVYEYPFALVLACLLRPALGGRGAAFVKWSDFALPAALFGAIAVPKMVGGIGLVLDDNISLFGASIVAGVVVYSFRERPLRFSLGVAIMAFALNAIYGWTDVLARERSFYGVYKVSRHDDGQFTVLHHGTTLHGAQRTDPARRREPLTYFTPQGPLGQLIARMAESGRLRQVGVAGLGAGTLACYRQPGQTWTFYEIDPLVEQLARDTRYFHYLSDCAGTADVIIGDARLSLQKAADRSYDLLILDAFSSDAVPVHLMTREAMALYLQKLADGGVMVFNITNRNLDLTPILANLANDAGLVGRVRSHHPDFETGWRNFQFPSRWVAIARHAQDLAAVAAEPEWQPLKPRPGVWVWTDDFSNLLSAFKW
jgi:hypothetical protein